MLENVGELTIEEEQEQDDPGAPLEHDLEVSRSADIYMLDKSMSAPSLPLAAPTQ